MIQLRLVFYHTAPDGSSTYQANTDNAYNLLRTGKLIELVGKHLGSSAANIIEILSSLGYATAEELEAHVAEDQASETPSSLAPSTNGHVEDKQIARVEGKPKNDFRGALVQLIKSKYIRAVRQAHFHSLFDARQEVERHLRSVGALSTSTTKKVKGEIDEKVSMELEKRLDGTVSAASVLKELEQASARTSSTNASQDKTLLCVDFSNLVASIRNEKISSTADKLFGKHAAQVAFAACSQVDVDSPSMRPFTSNDPTASTSNLDISRIADDLEELAASRIQNREHRENGWPVEHGLANGHTHSRLNGSRDDRQVERQLAVLAEGPFSFLLQDRVAHSWFADRTKLNAFLRDKELLRLMGENMSGPTLRIIRMLADKGKLDEKTMQDIGLLGAKELRKCLAQLQVMGFLELQEVPREPQRQPNRTIFLWFYDADRVRRVFLGKLYKAMSRLYQRLHLERTRLSSTLSKVERTDVQGSEEEMLSAAELQVLYQWRQKETWFMTEIHRMDDSIAILRDL